MVALSSCALFAHAQDSFNKRFSLAGIFNVEREKSGGSLEFGFRLYEKNHFVLRNYVLLSGYGGRFENGAGFGAAEISYKIIAGGFVPLSEMRIRSYGFTALGLGLFGTENHRVFTLPLVGSISVGGGFELQFSPHSAFMVEYGGKMETLFGGGFSRSAYGNVYGSPLVMLGARSYF